MKKILLFSVIIISCLCTTTYAQTREIDANELATSLMPHMTKPIVIDFWATWCGPCRQYSPTFHSVARLQSRQADFYRVDIDNNRDLVGIFEINAVPTTIVIYSKTGEHLKAEGILTAEELKTLIQKAQELLDLNDSF